MIWGFWSGAIIKNTHVSLLLDYEFLKGADLEPSYFPYCLAYESTNEGKINQSLTKEIDNKSKLFAKVPRKRHYKCKHNFSTLKCHTMKVTQNSAIITYLFTMF